MRLIQRLVDSLEKIASTLSELSLSKSEPDLTEIKLKLKKIESALFKEPENIQNTKLSTFGRFLKRH